MGTKESRYWTVLDLTYIVIGLCVGAIITLMTEWIPTNWQWWAIMVPIAFVGSHFLSVFEKQSKK